MKQTNKGSVLVLTIIITSALLGIGITLVSIIEKESLRQAFGFRSQQAFLIVDTAWECTLYNDFQQLSFSVGKLKLANTFTCGGLGESIKAVRRDTWEKYTPTIHTQINRGTVLEYKFVVVDESKEETPCADVVIQKYCGGENGCSDIKTKVTVIGYDSCRSPFDGSEFPERGDIHRRLEVVY